MDYKKSKTPFAALTAYSYTDAKIVDSADIPLILVGDSAAMVMLGYKNTLPITMDEMLIFVKSVSRGAKKALIVADMPFMSFQTSVKDALSNAGRFIKEGNAGAVKIEGGKHVLPQINAIVESGIPVMGHVGLTPQSFHQMSGHRIQGKDEKSALNIIKNAIAVEKAGAFSIVLEGIPKELSKIITEKLNIPTIGIGAGPFCNGQIQVYHDLLGLDNNFYPKHSKRYIELQTKAVEAINSYINDVSTKNFPKKEHSTNLKPNVLKSLL